MPLDAMQNSSDPNDTFHKKVGKLHRRYAVKDVEHIGLNRAVIGDFQFEKNTYSGIHSL